MDLNWSTLVFEIINFLILVWLLKRFLYRPVLDAIARRREQIQATLDEAQEERARVEEMRKQYESRLSDWEAEKETARTSLIHDLEQERARRLETLDKEIETERRKAQVLDERTREQARQDLEARSLALGARFASRLLTRLTGPELDGRLVDVTVDDLADITHEGGNDLRRAAAGEHALRVTSARSLDTAKREKLERALQDLAGKDLQVQYDENPDLLAGLRVRVGSFLLCANLQDELKSFAEAGRE